MRRFAKFIAVIFLTACIDKSHNRTSVLVPENSISVTTNLKDSLGKVSFSIPARFDTSFTWTNRSDCGKPCDHEQYRFQPKTLPIFKESGFFYEIPDIAIDQFTIIHSGYFPFHTGMDTSKNLGRHENFKSRLLSDPYNGKLISDKIESINNRYFSIVYFTGFDTLSKKNFAKVAALTAIKGNEIEFRYDLKTKDAINDKKFSESSIQLIRTIRISNNM
jgi:hypothetical protein